MKYRSSVFYLVTGIQNSEFGRCFMYSLSCFVSILFLASDMQHGTTAAMRHDAAALIGALSQIILNACVVHLKGAFEAFKSYICVYVFKLVFNCIFSIYFIVHRSCSSS
jgi:hypothetical protein